MGLTSEVLTDCVPCFGMISLYYQSMSLRFALRLLFGVLVLIGIFGLLSRYQLIRTVFQFEIVDRQNQTRQTVTLEGGPHSGDSLPDLLTPPEIELRSLTLLRRYESHDISAAQQRFLGASASATLPVSSSTIDRYEAVYDITLSNGEKVPLKSQLYIPISADRSSPVYVFGSGTTGLSDRCAPSREIPSVANWGDYQSHLLTQAAQDYIVVFPDYEGFNSLEKTQAYFQIKSEARVMAAALQLVDSLPNTVAATPDWEHVFLGGYSQGGHAAFSLASHPQLVDPDHKIVGIVAYAGASDVNALLSDRPALAPYIVESYRSWYGDKIETDRILQGRWISELPTQGGSWCIDEVYQKYPTSAYDIYTPEFVRALSRDRLAEEAPVFAQAIQDNMTFTPALNKIPVLSLQGATDPIVTAATQRTNRNVLCREGGVLWYQEYPNVNHFQIRSAGFIDTQKWFNTIVYGGSAASNCSDRI